ncbi:MAG TPA: VWA domain-containing protein [Thermoanaerobaculia bacterium]|nr:VWA domain-containing protein [Thermoanaerobaculia bacterium]
MPRSTLRLLAVFSLVGLPAVAAMAQTEPDPTFYESIDVNVANVEVYVTDKQGKRVQGLTKDDFLVFEDGQPVEITNFFAMSEGKAVAEEEPELTETPKPAAANPAVPKPDAQRLYLAIFLDNRTLVPATRKRVLDSVKELVSRLQPGDRILLAGYDNSVVIRQGLTNDPEALAAAIEEVSRAAAGGASRDSERQRILRQIDASDPVDGPQGGETQRAQAAIIIAQQLYQDIKLFGTSQLDETRAALHALEQFVDSLAGLPGRKAVLYVSGGMSLRPAEALMRAWETKFGSLGASVGFSPFDGRRDDATPFLKDLIDHANANRVTFYALGSTTELSGLSAESTASTVLTTEMAVTERMNLQSSLEMIADGTGGLASIDAAERPLIDRMRQDFDTYYSLGYVPRAGRDGKKRHVEVKARNAALKVRHRGTRSERTESERMTSRAMAALLLGEDDNPLEVSVELGKEKTNDKGQIEVEVLVKFPLANLVLVPQDQFHEGHLSLFLGARDSHGRSSAITEVDVPIRVPNDQLLTALGQIGAWKTTMLLRPEPHTVAVAVRDRIGNVDAVARAEYTPQPASPAP